MDSVAPLLVPRATAAAVLGCSARQLSRLEAAGVLAPAVPGRPGRPAQFDLRVVVAGYVRHVTSPEGLVPAVERARKDRAHAALAEQQFQARTRELLPAREVRLVWGQHVGAARARLLSLPRALAAPCVQAAAGGARAVEAVLTAAIRSALTELAGHAPTPERRPR